MVADIRFKSFVGSSVEPLIDKIASLRIGVFREFPYLYDGNLDYEYRYLRRYFNSPQSFVVLCMDGSNVVGASTGIPLVDDSHEMQDVFTAAEYDVSKIYYFGESVLLPAYRGKGIGKEFFAYRESHALTLPEIQYTAFCAVIRSADHPLKPHAYRPLDAFWRQAGYEMQKGLIGSFKWKDLDQQDQTEKQMQFWMKKIR